MAMLLIEQEFKVPAAGGCDGLLTHLRHACARRVPDQIDNIAVFILNIIGDDKFR